MDNQEPIDVGRFRDYLLILAQLHMGAKLREIVDPSDIVQQVLLAAHEKRGQFRGDNETALKAWLRQILANRIYYSFRSSKRANRDPDRVRSLQQVLDASSARLEQWLADEWSSPSLRMVKEEQVQELASALAALPDAQREALVLKHCQDWSLAQIGKHMDRTPEAVAGLLRRGTVRLRQILDASDSPVPSTS